MAVLLQYEVQIVCELSPYIQVPILVMFPSITETSFEWLSLPNGCVTVMEKSC